MKLPWFFLFSIALHAAVLAFPISFLETRVEQMIPVNLLEAGGNGDQGSARKAGVAGRATRVRATTPDDVSGGMRASEQMVSRTVASAETIKTSDQVSYVAEVLFTQGVVPAGLGSRGEAGAGILPGESASGGDRAGSGDRGRYGSGSGERGLGGGGGLAGLGFAQASYAHNPKPQYPEAARKEGWEGTVLLRVLVDREGKSKWVEVNRSSGFESLDRAAMETVKVWRFHPARYGERLVESWVKVPIVFSLAE